jgi:hypothetical protein
MILLQIIQSLKYSLNLAMKIRGDVGCYSPPDSFVHSMVTQKRYKINEQLKLWTVHYIHIYIYKLFLDAN